MENGGHLGFFRGHTGHREPGIQSLRLNKIKSHYPSNTMSRFTSDIYFCNIILIEYTAVGKARTWEMVAIFDFGSHIGHHYRGTKDKFSKMKLTSAI